MGWYLVVLKKYFDFSGRARRKEYWMFFLFNIIFAIIAVILDNILGITFEENITILESSFEKGTIGPIYTVYMLAVIIPSFAVLIRRLHDIGKSGWWYFIVFIPLIGIIWSFVLMATEGISGTNKYGVDPKTNC